MASTSADTESPNESFKQTGIHSVRVIEDMQCITVKQGPFLGADCDKVIVEHLKPKATP